MAYIYNLLSALKKWNISNISLDSEYLQLIAYEARSAYEITSYLEAMNKPLAYKYVHKRIKALKEFGLLKVDEETTKYSIHKPIYYGLTEFGVYYLARNGKLPLAKYTTITDLFKKLLRNYGDNILFKAVLYPYFKNETILNIYSSIYLYYIWLYLNNCCLRLENAIETEKNIQAGGEEIINWIDVAAGTTTQLKKLEDTRLMNYLHREFDVNWLENAEITKFDNDDILKISYKGKSITIELTEDRTKAILKIDRKKKKELNFDFLQFINVPLEPHEEYLVKSAALDKLDNLAIELAFALVTLPIDEHDIEVLSRDKKFMRLLDKTINTFESGSQSFLQRGMTSKDRHD